MRADADALLSSLYVSPLYVILSIINSLLSLLCRWNVNSELRVEGKAVQFILSTLNDTELDVALT